MPPSTLVRALPDAARRHPARQRDVADGYFTPAIVDTRGQRHGVRGPERSR
ncbi:hypothetical protein [Streptomyces odontomachi]|uniref:hypothetical protein n=1 Tax=Streptomyces odontomachi TaxID=2944940 RepID=UPI00210D00E6|nr:hypothetical protein [Streptomyces sp. ODS25]